MEWRSFLSIFRSIFKYAFYLRKKAFEKVHLYELSNSAPKPHKKTSVKVLEHFTNVHLVAKRFTNGI